tara:strand:+ start:296 stop:1354 length:1059 start_codon:yes stop_codon:yes gene_type:complete
MIRIDEIYNNVFSAFTKQISNDYVIHWFDPFGTTDFSTLANNNRINSTNDTRIICWDQEPIHRIRFQPFIEQFLQVHQTPMSLRLLTSEFDSEDVRWASDTYGVESDYYFFHAWAALDWYRGYDRTSLAQSFAERKPYNTFLCPNNIIGGERKHRIEMLQQFVGRNLLERNLISFPDTCPYEGQSLKLLCIKYDLDCPEVRLPLVIDNGSGYAAQSHLIDLWDQANNSLIHVVTETVYKGNKNHLTEKTFKPIAMQQPFIIQSCKGSLEYLRRYGFRTFGEFWDESYDEANDTVRTYEIGKLLQNLNTMSQKEKASLQSAVNSTVEHNYRWFYGVEFEQLLWKELTEMMNKW